MRISERSSSKRGEIGEYAAGFRKYADYPQSIKGQTERERERKKDVINMTKEQEEIQIYA